jgi:hypothetical protein
MAKSAKIQFLILALMITTLGTAQESGAGKIEGVVFLAGSRMPVAQARVVLGTLLSSQPPREVLTNKDGVFAFDRVPASALPYFVTVKREGYSQQDVRLRIEETNSLQADNVRSSLAGSVSPAIEIRPGTRVTAEFQLTTAGVLAGRISDHAGEATNVNVELIKVHDNSVFPSGTKSVTTDSDGKYRFDDVLPGEYFVRASLARFGPRYEAYGRISDTWQPDPLSATYYPGVSNRKQAAWVTVTPGSEFPAIDFLLARPSPLRITGRIENLLKFDLDSDPTLAEYRRMLVEYSRLRNGVTTNSQGFGIDAATSYSFYLAPKDQATGESSVIGPLPDYDNDAYRFELRHIPPGDYDLFVVFRPNTGNGYKWQPYVGRSVVKVTGSDIGNVAVRIERNAEMKGRIVHHDTVPGREPNRSGGKPTLTSVEPIPDVLRIDPSLQMRNFVETDGAFQIPGGVSPGRYRVSMMRYTLPAGVYLVKASLDGADVLGVPFTIEAGSKYELVLELRGDGGQLQGTVLDKDRRRIPNAAVVLVPPDNRRDDPAAYFSTTANARGEFTIEGIRPDSYTALAFPESVELDILRDASFVVPHLSRGRRVEMEKGKKVRTDLEPVSLP